MKNLDLDIAYKITQADATVVDDIKKLNGNSRSLRAIMNLLMRHATKDKSEFVESVLNALIESGAKPTSIDLEDACMYSYQEFILKILPYCENVTDDAITLACNNENIGELKNKDVLEAILKRAA